MIEEDENDDRRLLDLYRKEGDIGAFDRLVARHGRALYSYLVAVTRNRQDANEIFQETWLKVIRNPGGFHGGSFKAWITTIARRVWIDRLRKKSPSLVLDRPGLDGLPVVERVADTSTGSPSSRLETREDLARIRDAVQRLPPQQREVFLLRTQGELGFAEIARLLSIPLNTALGRMHYAVVKLRKELRT